MKYVQVCDPDVDVGAIMKKLDLNVDLLTRLMVRFCI